MKKIKCLTIGLSLLALSACSHKAQNGGSGLIKPTDYQNLSNDGVKMHASEVKPGYTAQVRRNSYGQIINSLVAPSNQTYYFDLDSNILHAKAYKALVIQANYLASHPNARVRLEGNTDSRGSREYNIALGWRRDQAVTKFLEQHGVLSAQIKEVSYGKERPAVLGNNEYAWRLNRRVNMVYEVK